MSTVSQEKMISSFTYIFTMASVTQSKGQWPPITYWSLDKTILQLVGKWLLEVSGCCWVKSVTNSVLPETNPCNCFGHEQIVMVAFSVYGKSSLANTYQNYSPSVSEAGKNVMQLHVLEHLSRSSRDGKTITLKVSVLNFRFVRHFHCVQFHYCSESS